MAEILKSLGYFILAGLCEIGGGYLIWLWLKEGKPIVYALAGAIILTIYGIIPTLQPQGNFGKIYAAYGGIFIVLSILWGWAIDNVIPDRFDIIGGFISLIGVAVIIPKFISIPGICSVRTVGIPIVALRHIIYIVV